MSLFLKNESTRQLGSKLSGTLNISSAIDFSSSVFPFQKINLMFTFNITSWQVCSLPLAREMSNMIKGYWFLLYIWYTSLTIRETFIRSHGRLLMKKNCRSALLRPIPCSGFDIYPLIWKRSSSALSFEASIPSSLQSSLDGLCCWKAINVWTWNGWKLKRHTTK